MKNPTVRQVRADAPTQSTRCVGPDLTHLRKGKFMENRFDDLTKALAEGIPRRQALRRLGSLFGGALLASLAFGGTARAGCPAGTFACGTRCCPAGTRCCRFMASPLICCSPSSANHYCNGQYWRCPSPGPWPG
jgi:hypothetical protein